MKTPKIDKTTQQQNREIERKRDKKAHELAKDSTVPWKDSLEINRGEEVESDELQEVVRHHRKGEAA
jgi:hypothetical protein